MSCCTFALEFIGTNGDTMDDQVISGIMVPNRTLVTPFFTDITKVTTGSFTTLNLFNKNVKGVFDTVIIPAKGLYTLAAQVHWVAPGNGFNGVGSRNIQVNVNEIPVALGYRPSAPETTNSTTGITTLTRELADIVIPANVGDRINVNISQTSGTTMQIFYITMLILFMSPITESPQIFGCTLDIGARLIAGDPTLLSGTQQIRDGNDPINPAIPTPVNVSLVPNTQLSYNNGMKVISNALQVITPGIYTIRGEIILSAPVSSLSFTTNGAREINLAFTDSTGASDILVRDTELAPYLLSGTTVIPQQSAIHTAFRFLFEAGDIIFMTAYQTNGKGATITVLYASLAVYIESIS